MDELSTVEGGSNYSSRRDDDIVMSSNSRFASPEDSKNKHKSSAESPMEIIPENKLPAGLDRKPPKTLKDGFVGCPKDKRSFRASCFKTKTSWWWLVSLCCIKCYKEGPSCSVPCYFKNKDTVGLLSFVAGGKLLQVNKKMELVFTSHTFDGWESWMLEGSLLECCKLINRRNSSVCLFVIIIVVIDKEEYIDNVPC